MLQKLKNKSIFSIKMSHLMLKKCFLPLRGLTLRLTELSNFPDYIRLNFKPARLASRISQLE